MTRPVCRLSILLVTLIVGCLPEGVAKAAMIIRVVRPISSHRVLPTGPVISGRVSSQLDVIACRGEYEPASFVITAKDDIDSLQVQAGDLEGPEGIIAANAIDIKVVKCWYQSGSKGEAADKEYSKRVLVPALLLNDDSLIKVNYQKKENYLKVPVPAKGKYIWISDPDEKEGDNPPIPSEEFSIKDSPVLLPVNIPANTNKQFWLTIHVPDDAKPGTYSGRITLSAASARTHLKLDLRVLPFELSKPYYTACMFYRNPTGDLRARQSLLRYRREMENLLAHGVEYPTYYPPGPQSDHEFLQIRKDLGMTGKPVYTITGAHYPISEVKERLSVLTSYGFTEVYFYSIDEASGERLFNQRPKWKATREAGGKVWTSGGREVGYQGKSKFDTVGDILDVYNCAFGPSPEEAEKWHKAGHRIFCYANPHVGQDDPDIYRRNYGLVLWRNNYDGTGIYAYQHRSGNPYNDFDGGMRELNLAYPTMNGVIDTIVWEGFREGIDDVRYLTTLTKAIEGAKESERKIAIEAEKYLEQMDVYKADLGAVRLRMIHYLVKLNAVSP